MAPLSKPRLPSVVELDGLRELYSLFRHTLPPNMVQLNMIENEHLQYSRRSFLVRTWFHGLKPAGVWKTRCVCWIFSIRYFNMNQLQYINQFIHNQKISQQMRKQISEQCVVFLKWIKKVPLASSHSPRFLGSQINFFQPRCSYKVVLNPRPICI